MLIYNGQIIAGGGTIVLPMTRAEYEANKAVLDTADVWIDLTDEPDQVATADEIAYRVSNVQKGMGYIGDIATKAIAKVEPTDTALYLHEVGTPFINKDGNYCITDVQIAVGGTITLGTNCHVVDGGINSNIPKFVVSYTPSSVQMAPTNSIDVTIVDPPEVTGKTVLARIPLYCSPQAHLNSYAVIQGFAENTKVATITCGGQGYAQAFNVWVLTIYHD